MALVLRRLPRILISSSGERPRLFSNNTSTDRLFTDVLDPDISAKPSILEIMHPDRLHSLRTKPFLYKVVNILREPELVTNLKESLQVWEGFIDVGLVGEALKHVDNAHAALAFFNWASTQPGFKHNGYTYNCLIRSLELCNAFTFDVTLRSLGRTGELDKLKLVCKEMEKRGLCPHPSTYESILYCYLFSWR